MSPIPEDEVATPRVDFASDNVSGAAPEVMAALLDANGNEEPPHGGDRVSREASDQLRALLACDAEVRFLASGTAANSFALACLVPGYGSVAAHHHAHVITDEAGAPSFFGQGLGFVGLAGQSGVIETDALRTTLAAPHVNRRQPIAALSLTIPTEYGVLYTDEHLCELIALAKMHGLAVHVDGARLANAAAAGFDVKRLGELGVDTLIVGGSKVGGTPSEALVVFNKALWASLDVRLKHVGQLVSKGRFLAAPWIGLLGSEDPAWLRYARHANDMARMLANMMPFPLAHAYHTNIIFVRMDPGSFNRLLDEGWSVHQASDGSVRFVCGWNMRPAAVEAICHSLARIS